MTEQLTEPKVEDTTVVSRVVSHPLQTVWKVLLTTAGQSALLGEGGQLGDKGDRWEAADGSFGVTRTYHPSEQIRFSWHADSDAPKTLVDVRLQAVDPATTLIEITHDHTGAGLDPVDVQARWKAALERIAADAL